MQTLVGLDGAVEGILGPEVLRQRQVQPSA